MQVSLDYLSLTYTLLGGVVFALGWLFTMKREIAVLQTEIKNIKDNHEENKHSLSKKLDSLETKFDTIIKLFLDKK